MVIHYQCPNCGDDMAFSSETGALSCSSCGRQDKIEDLSEEYISTTLDENEAKEYHCENCGAVILTDIDTTATTCSFCGSAVVLGDRLSGVLAPKKVLPFKISHEEATRAFKKWCKNGRLTPKGFMTASRIKEVTGMYVPFWLYDLNSKVYVQGTGTKVRKYTRGNYHYTETKYYHVMRDINLDYKKVPTDASEKMDDEIMDKLEPFHYNDLKEFKTPYLAGYIAEKYNYDDKELFPRAKQRIKGFIDTYIRKSVKGYTNTSFTQKDIKTKKVQSAYVLLPVWMVYYDYERSEHTFAMNGQTGKIVGKPPLSYGKIATWFGSIAGGSFIALRLVSFMLGGDL